MSGDADAGPDVLALAELLIEWARRAHGRVSGLSAIPDEHGSSTFEADLGRLYRLVLRFPQTGRTVDALLARIPPREPPDEALRWRLVAALTDLAGQDADLTGQVATLTRELVARLDFGRNYSAGLANDVYGGVGAVLADDVRGDVSFGEGPAETSSGSPGSWQERLRTLDEQLATGRVSVDDYRVRRDRILAAAVAEHGTAVPDEEDADHPADDDHPNGTGSSAPPPPQPAADPVGPTGVGDDPPRPAGSLSPHEPYLPPPELGSSLRDPSSDGWSRLAPEPFEVEAEPARPRWITRPRRRSPDPEARSPATERAGSSRYLLAHLPDRVPLHAEVSLVIRVSTMLSSPSTAAARLDRLSVPAVGAEIAVLVQAPAGLLPAGPLEQVLLVPPDGDSEPLRFAFGAVLAGLHRVRVMAFAGGTFLAELDVEVSVERGGPSVDGEPAVARLDGVQAREGEVTLQVRSAGGRTVFQLLSDTWLFEPVLAEALAGDPPAAVERAIDTLRQLATGRGPYAGGMARRWMRETGIGLWERVVPAVIKDQYWQLRDRITSFTIATSHDVIPWELLYPLRAGSDDGFLVEQFPVLRRVFGQQRCTRVAIAPCTYVVSGRTPANTRQEIDALSAVLGTAGVVEDLGELLDLLGSGQCGPLHFVCHNSFSGEAGSSIAMSGGPFVPGLLNSAAVQRSLAAKNPLVFLNACRTAGTVPEYSTMIGWAQQFMAAGAGAFVGTLWPVRSDSAGTFAEAFYTHLRGGESLGRAALLARRTAIQDGPDPTWLAYTVYGDPHAYAT